MSEAQRSEASDSTVRLERMVREAGWSGIYTQWVSPTERESMTVPVTPQQVLRFAAIVAAAEREECAKTCESIQAKTDKWGPMAGYCAEQIRMRSNYIYTSKMKNNLHGDK